MEIINSEEQISRFNIRVYGLFIHNGQILVTDEFRMGQYLTKFPGGGLKLGEGTIDCLKRECMEEFGQAIQDIEHFYTTDFFQPTYFLPRTEQLISIYYSASLTQPEALDCSTIPFDFPVVVEGAQTFRFIPLAKFSARLLTLPVDKYVAGVLMKKYKIH
jgi:8-oxo-dGTP diphosphatase